jgi:adenylate kinase family enzyme
LKRALVIGSGGSGKTTVARRLAERTGLPLIHLDRLYWRAGWEPTPAPEWEATVRRLLLGDAWIIDGNYGGTLDLRLAACDTVVFLDLPRLVCLWRVLKRQVGHLGRERPELAPGCKERLRWDFLVWIWTYGSRQRGDILKRLAALDSGKRVVILESSDAIEEFLASPAHPRPVQHRPPSASLG